MLETIRRRVVDGRLEVEGPDGRFLPWDSAERMQAEFDPSNINVAEVVIRPLLTQAPAWFVFGGLGDGDEVLQCHKIWPRSRYLGIDPDPRAIAWQVRHGWPTRQPLLRKALSDGQGLERMAMETLCCASLHPKVLAKYDPKQLQWIETTTVDLLDHLYGPFQDAVLWLDCEGYDGKALLGARGVLEDHKVQLLNWEVRYETDDENEHTYAYLESLGFERVKVWFRQWWGHNEVWRPKR